MNLSPMNLNETNNGYGHKPAQGRWQACLSITSRIKDRYDNGDYDYVINEAIDHLYGLRIRNISDLSKMEETDLAKFFYLGRAYLRVGKVENAAACFHIVFSQRGFGRHMLSHPMNFSSLTALAEQELQDIAIDRGENFVNGINVEEFMTNNLKKSGCFIATATYGSPLAPEVIFFRRFRDESLLPSKIGATAVDLYYAVSPPLAALIAKSSFLRAITRRLLLEPSLRVLRSSSSFKP